MKIARNFGFMMAFWLVSCVSNESNFLDKIVVEPVGNEAGVPLYVQSSGEQVGPEGVPIQWFSCTKEPYYPFLVMISPTQGEFTKAQSCSHVAALEGMKNGFNILLVNTPMQPTLSQSNSFGEEASLKQILKFLTLQAQEGRQLIGLWGFGDGSILTMQLSRLLPWKFLIIGNGIYDWEQTIKESKDPLFTMRLKTAAGHEAAVFAEKHSVAWDLTGLPKKIYLYHGSKNTQILASQAGQFKTSLAASEYQVEVFFLDEDGADLRMEFHRGVLNKIFSRCQGGQ